MLFFKSQRCEWWASPHFSISSFPHSGCCFTLKRLSATLVCFYLFTCSLQRHKVKLQLCGDRCGCGCVSVCHTQVVAKVVDSLLVFIDQPAEGIMSWQTAAHPNKNANQAALLAADSSEKLFDFFSIKASLVRSFFFSLLNVICSPFLGNAYPHTAGGEVEDIQGAVANTEALIVVFALQSNLFQVDRNV